MAWTRLKTAALFVLVVGIVVILTPSPAGSFGPGSLKLPVGKGTPAVSLGQSHGLILASDGSLWSWG